MNKSPKKEKDVKSLKLKPKGYCNAPLDVSFLDNNGTPRVSICIVTKDGHGVIDKCLYSIFKYVEYSDFEILICDTGTTDQRVLNNYKYLESKYGDKVKVFRDHVYNFSKNNNFLAKQSTGDVLLFMNNDIFLTYDAISEMVKYINCSNIGCLGHRLVWDSDKQSIQHDGQIIYDEKGTWIAPGHSNYRKRLDKVSNENSLVNGVTAAFLMIRKSIFNNVKGFDEDYKDIYQDVDLNLKVSKMGYDNFCIRKKPIIHVDHSTRKDDATPDSSYDAKKYANDWTRRGKYETKPESSYVLLSHFGWFLTRKKIQSKIRKFVRGLLRLLN